MNNLVSIIIPIFNVEKYLSRCIQSVVDQTYRNLEIILVDDGSEDNCSKICDDWKKKDSRIKVIHKKNGGLSSARNTGLSKAMGNYIMFLDSDDWLELDTIQTAVDNFDENQNIDIFQFDYYYDNGKIKEYNRPKEKKQYFEKKDMMDYFFRIHGEKSNTSVCTMIYRRNIVIDYSFLNTLNEDVEACLEFYTRANLVLNTNIPYYHYYFNDKSITNSSFTVKDLDYLMVWDRVNEKIALSNPDYINYAKQSKLRAYFTLLSKMRIRGYDKNNEELNKIHKMLKRKVRKNFISIISIKMSISRKFLLIFLTIFG